MADNSMNAEYILKGVIQVDRTGEQKALTETQKQLEKALLAYKANEAAAKQAAATATTAAQSQASAITASAQKITQSATALNTQMQATTASTSTLASTLSGLAGPATVAVGAMAAIAGAEVAIGVGLFELAKHASDFGDKFYDASQKVNISAHELSALKIAAEQSGGSFAGLTTALGLFDKNLELAASGSSKKLAKLFGELKVNTSDNTLALQQMFVALSKLPPGAQQTALAMEAFGRSGKDVLGIIKQTGADLPAFIKLMDEMGLTISDKDAEAANQFSDQLKTLDAQMEMVEVRVGMKLIPAFEQLMDAFSQNIVAGKSFVDLMANGIAFWVDSNVKSIQTYVHWVHELIAGYMALSSEGQALSKTFTQQGIFQHFLDQMEGQTQEQD